jgi:hypothetical protein
VVNAGNCRNRKAFYRIVMTHWGGPVKLLDLSRATPYIVLNSSEKKSIIRELDGKINEEDLETLFSYLELREIVDIDFDDK